MNAINDRIRITQTMRLEGDRLVARIEGQVGAGQEPLPPPNDRYVGVVAEVRLRSSDPRPALHAQAQAAYSDVLAITLGLLAVDSLEPDDRQHKLHTIREVM